jgi:para-aminobenzoate synthetase component 1
VSLKGNENHPFGGTGVRTSVGRPPEWSGQLLEVERVETADPAELIAFLGSHGLAGEPAQQAGDVAVQLLVGSRGCAAIGGVPLGAESPVRVPECVAVAYRRGGSPPPAPGGAAVGEWTSSWSDAQHAAAVEQVRAAIARGDVYQANVVGHRCAPFTGDPAALAAAVVALPGAAYRESVSGEGWTVASASPEQLVRVVGDRITTVPIKGTSREPAVLLASGKDRAEHIMIVDLERNDLARVTVPGSVEVEELYDVAEWAGLWHASSVVAGALALGAGTADVLKALLPGGSVTGAPKHAACALLAGLEPVGRGPAMGALGFAWPGGLDLGLTIRTIAACDGLVHLWAGGGITWGSDPQDEVAEAHAKAAPVQGALAQVRPSAS